ncbi:MAG: hypothetical protein IPO92_02350 [Saprospiraceae bacterium]|nr:hypothetical protein [Saprospiraceae bacterium]
MPATFANLYIKQKKYDEAIPKLILAIENEDNKQLKARYSFIAGQISQLQNDNNAALNFFADAEKYAIDNKMEFMSELAIAKNGIISGRKSKKDVISDLLDMLKEDKYATLKDQIYFTLAEIELSQKNETEAIAYFKKSVANNVSDQKLKGEAYINIANLYYNNEKYLESSNYFDTTLTLLSSTDERYSQVQKYVANLKEIAANIFLIQYQDTLLYFASLSEKDQKKVVSAWIEKNKPSEVMVEEKKGPISKSLSTSRGIDFGVSTFFAYNKLTKLKGKDDFEKVWGKHTLEDDWRRSSKSNSSPIVEEEVKVAESDGKEETVSNEEYNKFIKSLPDNPVKKQEVNDKISKAMFTLGKLFRDKIEKYLKSAETLEGMHARYGATPYELDSYYYLYLDYIDLNNSAKAEEFKAKIVRKYPDSKYASILNDPDFFSKTQKKANNPEEFYKSVYALFSKGQYALALERIEKAGTIVDQELDNPYLAKMALLRAMCLGSKEGKDAYVKALNEVIVGYPNTPEQSKAKEIMRFLGGDKSAFASVNPEDVDKIYQKEDDQNHYVAVITYGLDETQNVNVKVAISEYNKKNFKVDRLQFGDASLNITDNSQVILVRKFENAAKVMEYYNKVIKDKDEYLGQPGMNVDILPISQRNYRKMLSERTAVAYRVFFETNYLGNK